MKNTHTQKPKPKATGLSSPNCSYECANDWYSVVNDTTHNHSDNLPSCPSINTAQMLSTGDEEVSINVTK